MANNRSAPSATARTNVNTALPTDRPTSTAPSDPQNEGTTYAAPSDPQNDATTYAAPSDPQNDATTYAAPSDPQNEATTYAAPSDPQNEATTYPPNDQDSTYAAPFPGDPTTYPPYDYDYNGYDYGYDDYDYDYYFGGMEEETKEEQYEVEEAIRAELALQNDSTVFDMGHQFEDLVFECSFRGYDCRFVNLNDSATVVCSTHFKV